MNTIINFLKIQDWDISDINKFVLELKNIGDTETKENYALLNEEYQTYIFWLDIPDNFDYTKDYILFQTNMDDASTALSIFAKKYNISLTYELCEFLNLFVEYYYINNDWTMFHIQLEDEDFETIQEEDWKGEYYDVLKDDFDEWIEEHYLEKLNNKRLEYFNQFEINDILNNKKLEKLKKFMDSHSWIDARLENDILKVSFRNEYALDNPLFGETQYGVVQFHADSMFIYAVVNLNKLFAE